MSKHNILGSLEDIPTFPHAWQPGIQCCGDGDSVVTVKEIVLSIVGVSAGCRDVVGMVTGDRMTISASYTTLHFHLDHSLKIQHCRRKNIFKNQMKYVQSLHLICSIIRSSPNLHVRILLTVMTFRYTCWTFSTLLFMLTLL